MASQTLPNKKLLLWSTAGLLALVFVFSNKALRIQCSVWSTVIWSSLVEHRTCMVLRPVDTNDHLKEVLHQCAMGPHKSWLLMITKEGYFKIDPSDMISGNTQRPYHRLIGLVESDLDKGSELETSYDDWQAVHIELGGFSEVRVRIDDKTENFLDLETAVSNTQGKTTSRSQILWVLHASLVEPCDKVLIAWNLLQAKGQPVWIKWKGRFGEPR